MVSHLPLEGYSGLRRVINIIDCVKKKRLLGSSRFARDLSASALELSEAPLDPVSCIEHLPKTGCASARNFISAQIRCKNGGYFEYIVPSYFADICKYYLHFRGGVLNCAPDQ